MAREKSPDATKEIDDVIATSHVGQLQHRVEQDLGRVAMRLPKRLRSDAVHVIAHRDARVRRGIKRRALERSQIKCDSSFGAAASDREGLRRPDRP